MSSVLFVPRDRPVLETINKAIVARCLTPRCCTHFTLRLLEAYHVSAAVNLLDFTPVAHKAFKEYNVRFIQYVHMILTYKRVWLISS